MDNNLNYVSSTDNKADEVPVLLSEESTTSQFLDNKAEDDPILLSEESTTSQFLNNKAEDDPILLSEESTTSQFLNNKTEDDPILLSEELTILDNKADDVPLLLSEDFSNFVDDLLNQEEAERKCKLDNLLEDSETPKKKRKQDISNFVDDQEEAERKCKLDNLLEDSETPKKKSKLENTEDDCKNQTEFTQKIGVLAFSFDKNPLNGVNSFTLATFQNAVINEPCKKNWIEELKYFVQTFKITELYVQGFQQCLYLRSKLPVYISKIPRKESVQCPKCHRFACSIYKVKNFFYTRYNYNLPIEC